MNHEDYSRQDLIDLVNRQSQIIYEMYKAIDELEDDLEALTENYNNVLLAYEELRQEKTGRRY